jgi:MFS family permease
MDKTRSSKLQTVPTARPTIYYGWVMVGVGLVTLAVAFGVWYSFSVFFLAIIKDFGWSRAAASTIFSVFLFSQALTGLLAGMLQDRFGPRVVIPMGSLVLALSLYLTSQAQGLLHFRLFYGVLAGAGVGLLGFTSHAAFLPKWFERKRGLAVGTAMSGIGFGMLVLIPLIERSISAHGWRDTYIYLAGLVLFLVGPLNLIFSRHSPQALNLRPDGDDAETDSRARASKMILELVDGEWARREWTLKRAVLTNRFWFLLFAFFFLSFSYQGTLLHSVSAMVDAGFARETGAYYFGILGLAGSGGKILMGYLSDLFGRERIHSLGGALAILGILSLLAASHLQGPLPLLFAILFGVGYGAAAPLMPSVSADIFFGNSFGLIFAMICIGAGAGGASGSFMAGLLRDLSGAYSIPFTVFCVTLSLSCTLIWFASPRKVRRMVRRRGKEPVRRLD